MENPSVSSSSILSTKDLTGGISYVKKSEDPTLPIIAFRADSDILARVGSMEQVIQLKEILVNQIEQPSCSITTINCDKLKEYLLFSKKRGKLLASRLEVESFGDIDFTKNNVAIVLHFRFSKDRLIKPIKKKLSKANLMIVLWTYKSQASKEISERLCFEVFVQEKLWNSLSEIKQEEIKYFQVILEEFIHITVPSRRLSSNRDGPSLELLCEDTPLITGEEIDSPIKHQWFFPNNGLPIGVTTFTGIFTEEELDLIEKHIDEELINAPFDKFLPNTFQNTERGKNLVRSKIFFGARYIWGDGKVDRHDPSAGVRLDVDEPPEWLHSLVEDRLHEHNLIPSSRDWINSWAINIYHNGSLGLHSHMDDVSRFEQPIFTLRLYSPSRLTFGATGLGMINPLFYIPMPRGCITVLEKDGFAANKVTHCIRPSDMNGKSAAIILRRIRPDVMEAARKMLP